MGSNPTLHLRLSEFDILQHGSVQEIINAYEQDEEIAADANGYKSKYFEGTCYSGEYSATLNITVEILNLFIETPLYSSLSLIFGFDSSL